MPQPTVPIRVLLVDDHEHVLWGLGKLIEGERPRMMVVGKARNMTEALALTREHRPDVVLLDVYLGKDNSLDRLAELLALSEAKVLVMSGARDSSIQRRAIEGGAGAFLHKDEAADAFVAAIERMHAEESRQSAAIVDTKKDFGGQGTLHGSLNSKK
jgi:two-component system nitrate/nitrite response regulator NarL